MLEKNLMNQFRKISQSFYCKKNECITGEENMQWALQRKNKMKRWKLVCPERAQVYLKCIKLQHGKYIFPQILASKFICLYISHAFRTGPCKPILYNFERSSPTPHTQCIGRWWYKCCTCNAAL